MSNVDKDCRCIEKPTIQPVNKPQVTFKELYRLTIKKIKRHIRVSPHTQIKIRELLKILAAEDELLSYTTLKKTCLEKRHFLIKNGNQQYKSPENTTKRFLSRILPCMIEEHILYKTKDGRRRGYELAYIVEPKPHNPDEGKKGVDGNPFPQTLRELVNCYNRLIELKHYFDVTRNEDLIPAIQPLICVFRKELFKLKMSLKKDRDVK
ncbi:MAG: hypothetical protein ACP5FL_04535 [Thermoplasmatota archaeon]